MRKMLIVLLFTSLAALAGCERSTTPPLPTPIKMPTKPPPTSTPVPKTDEEAIWQLLNAEKEAVLQQDIDRMLDIWDKDGEIVDANHTPDDPKDDRIWKGHEAIRDRYVTIVFPSAPDEASAPEAEITIEGDKATAISTTHIGTEVSPSGDRWTFAKKDGRWKITSLTYNLEPK
ncbi:MAG: YybH family protein [Anaerolineae bacterium]